MRVIPSSQFKTTAWKNLGGITHEIAKQETAAGLVWRLSVAEVDKDGAFSTFEGLTRVLTVIEGAGLRLIHPDGIIDALPARPVRFSGELPVTGQRIDGPVRDFNVIFDGQRVEATVTPLAKGNQVTPPAAVGRSFALYCITGRLTVGMAQEIESGALGLFGESCGPITLGADSAALLVTLDRRA